MAGAFLITFKPASENPKRGWPLESLQALVRRLGAGETVEEKWRCQNQKNVAIGDRLFLLLQGKRGPAIIGYGRATGTPAKHDGVRQVPVRFEKLVDPMTYVLANNMDLAAIEDAEKYWRSVGSGVQLSSAVAVGLESLVVGKNVKPWTKETVPNPDWTRDELIIALSAYLKHRPTVPDKRSKEISELSKVLNRLGDKLFPADQRASTFRNNNGVYMKLMNFRRFDPTFTSRGRSGLSRGNQGEEEVWNEFSSDADRCHRTAEAIVASLSDPDAPAVAYDVDDDDFQDAPEGRALTKWHMSRERNRKLVTKKKRQSLKRLGKLVCSVCTFDFSIHYGERGDGFVECHHTKPVATLAAGHRTHLDDLALVCANCHRMIHRRRPWLTIEELRKLIKGMPT
jgi:5-methylcytosine-specific restriction protein A